MCNLSDHKYSKEYLSFRRASEETVNSTIKNLNVRSSSNEKLLSEKLVSLFEGKEGPIKVSFSRGPFKLDPAPLAQMVSRVIEKAKPKRNFDFDQDVRLTNSSEAVEKIIPVIANVCRGLEKWDSDSGSILPQIVDNIKLQLLKGGTIKKQSDSYMSVDVERSGTTVISSYSIDFNEEIGKGIIWNSKLVKLRIKIRVFEYPIIADLKNEYLRITEGGDCNGDNDLD